jgi:hypothetical protein
MANRAQHAVLQLHVPVQRLPNQSQDYVPYTILTVILFSGELNCTLKIDSFTFLGRKKRGKLKMT